MTVGSSHRDDAAADRDQRALTYLKRAAELRIVADKLITQQARETLLATAAEYEKMAAALQRFRPS